MLLHSTSVLLSYIFREFLCFAASKLVVEGLHILCQVAELLLQFPQSQVTVQALVMQELVRLQPGCHVDDQIPDLREALERPTHLEGNTQLKVDAGRGQFTEMSFRVDVRTYLFLQFVQRIVTCQNTVHCLFVLHSRKHPRGGVHLTHAGVVFLHTLDTLGPDDTLQSRKHLY